jgi:hypothetical protein
MASKVETSSKRKGISTAARKSKGRQLQQKVRDAILAAFTKLEPDDVKSTGMGQGGEDVQLSPAARKFFPYSVECKRHKAFAVYGPYEQAKANSMGYEPILVIQGDRKKPLVLVDLDHFIELTTRKPNG